MRRRPRPPQSEYRVQLAPTPTDKSEPANVDQLRQLALEFVAALKPERAAPTLEDFAPRWIREHAQANRQKPRGISSKQSHLDNHLLPRLGTLPLNLISEEHVAGLKAYLSDRKAKTVNNVLSTLRCLLKVAVKWKVLERMPGGLEPLPAPPSPFAFYDFDAYSTLLRAATDELFADPRPFAVVVLGAEAGLRLGEMIALEWGDVDWKREQLLVQRSQSQGDVTAPKNGRHRYVPMSRRILTALQALYVDRPRDRARVLLTTIRTPVNERRVRALFARVQKLAGLRETGLHILRHTFCSHLAMRGAPAVAIKELAGHTTLVTTERYMHLSPKVGRAVISLLNGAPNGFRPGLTPTPQPTPRSAEKAGPESPTSGPSMRGVRDLNPCPPPANPLPRPRGRNSKDGAGGRAGRARRLLRELLAELDRE